MFLSDEQQYWLELVNFFRANPEAALDDLILDMKMSVGANDYISNALRYFEVDLDVLTQQFSELEAVSPLAWNDELYQSSYTHSELVIQYDEQSHYLPGEPDLIERVQEAGYDQVRQIAENVFAYTENTLHGHAGFVIDWGGGTYGIQEPAGHRNALMNSIYTEIGIAILEVSDTNLSVGPTVVTQHMATSWDADTYLLGVIIDDMDGDSFYDVGEGLGAVQVTAEGAQGTFSTTSWASGGYQMVLPNGDYTVTFSGEALDLNVTQSVTIDGENVKLDVDTNTFVFGPSEFNDVLTGSWTDDFVDLLAGNDIFDAAGGDDTIIGGAGDDSLTGGIGADSMDGGEGLDLLDYSAETSRVLVDLQADVGGAEYARFFSSGAAEGDVFSNMENISGGAAADNLRGDENGNLFLGGGVSDRLYGRAGDDTLDGQAGSDAIYGGMGVDVMTGGDDSGSRDRFIYFHVAETSVGNGSRDVITDFESGRDRIEISRLDANILTAAAREVFVFIGADAFSRQAGQLRYSLEGGMTIVQADLDGDGEANFEIELTGSMALAETDFLL